MNIALGFVSFFCLLLIFLLFLQRRRWQRQQMRITHLTEDLDRILAGEGLSLFQTEEDALGRLTCSLTKAVTRLAASEQKASRAHRQLADNLADISHQLKTPVTGMRLLLDVWSDHHGETPTICDNLYINLDHLEKSLDSLLTLARIDAGTLPLKTEPVHSDRVLEEALSIVDPLLREKCLDLRQIGPPLVWQGDVFWCSEILINLLKNAAEHSPKNSTLTIRLDTNPLFNEITLHDNGKGIAPEDKAHVFKRFYKGQGAAKESIGIGLALARELALLQGGSLRVYNAKEGGTIFKLQFPPLVTEVSSEGRILGTKE